MFHSTHLIVCLTKTENLLQLCFFSGGSELKSERGVAWNMSEEVAQLLDSTTIHQCIQATRYIAGLFLKLHGRVIYYVRKNAALCVRLRGCIGITIHWRRGSRVHLHRQEELPTLLYKYSSTSNYVNEYHPYCMIWLNVVDHYATTSRSCEAYILPATFSQLQIGIPVCRPYQRSAWSH